MEEDDHIAKIVMKVIKEVKLSTLNSKKVKGGSKGKGNKGSGFSPTTSEVKISPRLPKHGG